MTVIYESSVRLWLGAGQKDITMMDMAHSKHEKFKGQHWGLTSMDGDRRIITIAWGLCTIENEQTYTTFLKDLQRFKLDGVSVIKEAMDRSDHVNFSDRFKGIPAAQKSVFPSMRAKNCLKHMIPNIAKAPGVSNFNPHAQGFFWKAGTAVTKHAFLAAMEELKKVCPGAVTYLNKIGDEKWALYPDATTQALYGHKCSNLIESRNSTYVPARGMAPLRVLDNITEVVMKDISDKRAAATKRYNGGGGHLLTKWAADQYEQQRSLSSHYTVTGSSEHVFFVDVGSGGRHRVDLQQNTCACSFWKQWGLPCRHAIAAANSDGRMGDFNEFITWAFDPMYLMVNYTKALKDTICEVIDLATLTPDGITKPNLNVKQAGRPRTRRIRSSGATAADGGTTRRGRVQTCNSCGTTGHNERTCTEKQWG